MVSNLGRIKSFLKYNDGYIRSVKNSKEDYLRIVLCGRGNVRKTKGIHALVASAFIGDIPPGWQVHHIDGDKQNNTVSNLEIIHPREHRAETKRMYPQIEAGMVNYNKYVKPREVQQYTIDDVLVASYPNAMEASRATGVCHRNILQVADGTPYDAKGNMRKQAGGYVWKFKKESEGMLCEI